jgi:hypothetical protein
VYFFNQLCKTSTLFSETADLADKLLFLGKRRALNVKIKTMYYIASSPGGEKLNI